MRTTLQVNERLLPGEELRSADGVTVLRFQDDGELALRRAGAVTWTAGTGGRGPAGLRMQADGDLVAYGADGEVLWAVRAGASALVVQDDGRLTLVDADGKPRWTAEPPVDGECGPLALTSFAVLL